MLNLTTRIIQNYCQRGLLQEKFTDTGRRLVTHQSLVTFLNDNNLLEGDREDSRYDVIYARVSTHKQNTRGDLDRQISRLKE